MNTLAPIEIHTSDRYFFRRCRRRWNWSSPIKGHNLETKDSSIGPLWLGSGFHFALEDYHGYQRFNHPTEAFEAYVKAFRRAQLPDDWEELTELGLSMLSYYADIWLPKREHFATLVLPDGSPAVEVSWSIPIMYTAEGREVHYVGTFDRVVVDSEGRLWVEDYKTAARFDAASLETDAQISAYTWAARQLYGPRVEGVLWIQFLKKQAKGPPVLQSGEFSQNKLQSTPYWLYRAALLEKFGEVPQRYVEFLNSLAEQETADGDGFIKLFRVRRSPEHSQNLLAQIMHEVADMLDPGLPLYPNPTRDCAWDCPFRSPCLALDDGYDHESILLDNFQLRTPMDHGGWRSRIIYPNDR